MWVAETQVLEPFSVAFPDRLEMMQLELQFVPIYGMLDATAFLTSVMVPVVL